MSFSGQKHLERAILEAIVYFDLFDYPLTTLEVWSNLRITTSYGEVYKTLQEDTWLKGRVKNKNGMWMLNKANILKRQQHYRASKYKLDKARKFVRFLKWVPWIQAVYACNSLGFLASRPESDIDFFIVARQGRIWSARFFTVLLAKLFGQRPTANLRKDTFCFSFYAIEGADMNKAALSGEDIYYDFWLKNLLRIWERSQPIAKHPDIRSGCLAMGIGEKIFRALQLWIMPSRLKDMANKGTAVIINDEFLKFHDHDRREHFRNEFKRRLANVVE